MKANIKAILDDHGLIGVSASAIQVLQSQADAIELLLEKFTELDSQSKDFYAKCTEMFDAVDKFRIALEENINKAASDKQDKDQLREDLLNVLVKPIFAELTKSEMIIKIVEALKENQQWLQDVAGRTLKHKIGFLKIAILSEGGKTYPLAEEAQTAGLTTWSDPSFEFRLHLYPPQDITKPTERGHIHSFDLLSTVSPFGCLVDQQYDLYSIDDPKDSKSLFDALGIDEKRPVQLQEESLEKAMARMHLDSSAPPAKVTAFQTYHTELAVTNAATGKKELDTVTKGRVVKLQQVDGKKYLLVPKQVATALPESTRLHASRNPHFVMYDPIQQTYTVCMTMRRKGEDGEYLSSAILQAEQDPSLTWGQSTASTVKAVESTETPESLKNLLENFLEQAYFERAYAVLLSKANGFIKTNTFAAKGESKKPKITEGEQISLGQVCTKMIIFLRLLNKQDITKPIDSNDIMSLFGAKGISTQELLMSTSKSVTAPDLYLDIYKEALRQSLAQQFHATYGVKLDFAKECKLSIVGALLESCEIYKSAVEAADREVKIKQNRKMM